MTNLIEIINNKINNSAVNTVNARELHNFLEVPTKFSDWIQRRISDYGFAENKDFVVLLKNEKNPIGGRPTKEIFITLDMAKELSMVERNEKGKEARQYFIEMESIAKKSISLIPDFTNPAEAARAWAEQYENRAIAEQKLIQAQPKIEFVNRYVANTGLRTITEVSKILKVKRKDLIESLICDKALYRQNGALLPYQDKLERGYFDVKTGSANDAYNYSQTLVTGLGVEWIAKRYASELM